MSVGQLKFSFLILLCVSIGAVSGCANDIDRSFDSLSDSDFQTQNDDQSDDGGNQDDSSSDDSKTFEASDVFQSVLPDTDRIQNPGEVFSCEVQLVDAIDIDSLSIEIVRLDDSVEPAEVVDVLESLSGPAAEVAASGLSRVLRINEIGQVLACRVTADLENSQSISVVSDGRTIVEASDDLDQIFEGISLSPRKILAGGTLLCEASFNFSGFSEASQIDVNFEIYNRKGQLLREAPADEIEFSEDGLQLAAKYETRKSKRNRVVVCRVDIDLSSGESVTAYSDKSAVVKRIHYCGPLYRASRVENFAHEMGVVETRPEVGPRLQAQKLCHCVRPARRVHPVISTATRIDHRAVKWCYSISAATEFETRP